MMVKTASTGSKSVGKRSANEEVDDAGSDRKRRKTENVEPEVAMEELARTENERLGLNIVQEAIPLAIADLTQFLSSSICFDPSDTSGPFARAKERNLHKELEKLAADGLNAPGSFQIQSNRGGEGDGDFSPTDGHVLVLHRAIKPRLVNAIKVAGDVERWLLMASPKLQIDENHGVSVQQEGLERIRKFTKDCHLRMVDTIQYHLKRMIIMKEMLDADDEEKIIKVKKRDDFDKEQITNWIVITMKLKTEYILILDFFRKNFELLQRPLTSDDERPDYLY